MTGIATHFDVAPLVGALRALPRALDSTIEAAVRRGGQLVADQARGAHDYTDRTGLLTRSIHPMAVDGAFSHDDLTGGAGAVTYYASFVEDGTRRMHVRHGYGFLRLAFSAKRDAIEDGLQSALDEAVARVGLS
jgi:hypothetical protein